MSTEADPKDVTKPKKHRESHKASAATEPKSEGETGDLQAKCEELEARLLRAQADYQNLRRRSLADLEAALRREMQPLLEELLHVLDFLDMALAAPVQSDEAKNLATGVEMTRSRLVQALENAGVHPVPTEGPFDPRLHEATEAVSAEGRSPGTIVETVRRGYTWQDHVLRPARVKVAAGEETNEPDPSRSTGEEG